MKNTVSSTKIQYQHFGFSIITHTQYHQNLGIIVRGRAQRKSGRQSSTEICLPVRIQQCYGTFITAFITQVVVRDKYSFLPVNTVT